MFSGEESSLVTTLSAAALSLSQLRQQLDKEAGCLISHLGKRPHDNTANDTKVKRVQVAHQRIRRRVTTMLEETDWLYFAVTYLAEAQRAARAQLACTLDEDVLAAGCVPPLSPTLEDLLETGQ